MAAEDAEPTEFSFLVERDGDRFTISSNDGGGTACWDIEDICVYMHQTVRVWCDDLREAERDRLAEEEDDDDEVQAGTV